MSFLCQRQSYLKEYFTKIKSCLPSVITTLENGKKIKLEGYDVILEDTILFPEGGGQPDDSGTINGIPVLRVTRKGAEAVHFVKTEIPALTDASLVVDWKRRFDHMQIHTAQHLITAVIDSKYGYQTTSWNIGTGIAVIELDTPSMTSEQMQEAEKIVNEHIQNCLSVTPIIYEDKEDPALRKFRGNGLPDDHVGCVRVLVIDGIDSALCCGTHVSNLSHIQGIKLLCVEKGKKNKINISFLAGGRLLNYVGQSFDREKALTGLLKGPAEKHCELAEKAVKGMKLFQKNSNQQLREIAMLEVSLFKHQIGEEIVFIKHRKEGDNDYISVLLGELSDLAIPKLITIGDDKLGGLFTLVGDDKLLQDLGPQICDIFKGKGALSNGVYRGKATQLVNRATAEKMLRDYITQSRKGDLQLETED